ncbi:MAG: dephospho-CoA kinase [Chloroflexi bacterium RBG_16_72_14]|nr:MAG: dephospho-CoA kinase [Chloroflexi bacterium RBG_16_72_14]
MRIGITGPIGCGKTQVVRWLAELGVHVVDADAVTRAVTSPGSAVQAAILRRFGPAVTAPDGALDRAALGRVVFSDPAALRELEAIVHPAVRPRILDQIDAAEAAGAPAVAVEAIKLVEGGLAGLCDEVWVVTCDPAVQLERILARGTPPRDAEQRLAAQAGLADRLRPSATRVLDTSGTLAQTRAEVVAALGEAIAARRRA